MKHPTHVDARRVGYSPSLGGGDDDEATFSFLMIFNKNQKIIETKKTEIIDRY